MSDVADMLGIQYRKQSLSMTEQAAKLLAEQRSGNAAKKNLKVVKKPKGMKREVYDLLGEDALVPAVQTNTAPTFKRKRQVTTGRWIWAPIESSARTDNPNPIFFHWVKADIHYNDYPYAKYHVHEKKIEYSDEEYQSLLNDDNWTRADTDQLVELCAMYSLRWPVIYDRLQLSSPKPIEQVMARYYYIVSQLNNSIDKSLPMHGLSIHDKSNTATDFDLEKETRRRRGQDLLFRRTKEDEQEEIRIKEEIKAIDTMLKKNKKQSKSNNANTATSQATTTAAIHPSSSSLSLLHLPATSSSALAGGENKISNGEGAVVTEGVSQVSLTNPSQETYLGPQRKKPCLLSSRLYLHDTNLNLSKSLVSKMHAYLKELNIPERPMPTKRVCDLVDQVRKDTMNLVSLHNQIKKKEKDLQAIKTGSGKGTTKSTSRSSAARGDKPARPRAPKNKATKAATTSSLPSEATNVGATASPGGAIDTSTNSHDLSLLPSMSVDGGSLLHSKNDFADLLDVFDHDDPFDNFIFDTKKEHEISPIPPKTKAKRNSNRDSTGSSQPKKRAKKNQE